MICIKCRREYVETHECIEEMSLDELFKESHREVREHMDEALHPNGRCTCQGEGACAWCKWAVVLPPDQDPEDEGFKP